MAFSTPFVMLGLTIRRYKVIVVYYFFFKGGKIRKEAAASAEVRGGRGFDGLPTCGEILMIVYGVFSFFLFLRVRTLLIRILPCHKPCVSHPPILISTTSYHPYFPKNICGGIISESFTLPMNHKSPRPQ